MSWNEYDKSPNSGRKIAIVAVIAMAFLALGGYLLLGTGGGTTTNNTATGPSTPNGDNPNTVTSFPTEEEFLAEEEYQGEDAAPTSTTTTVLAYDGEGEAEAGYENAFIDPSQFASVYADANSGLDDATRTTLASVARQLVEAQITGNGRDKFPGYWRFPNDPDLPYATGFTIDFATAMRSDFTYGQNYPLYRTVVVWHGLGRGDIPFRQVRIANYFTPDNSGGFKPVVNDALPRTVLQADPLVAGTSIIG